MRDIMVHEGLSEDEARAQFWGLGSRGLLHSDARMRAFQQPYARPAAELVDWAVRTPGVYDLADVVRNVQPTILIGTSAQPDAFDEAIVTQMAAHCERPVIMPLSNPTSLSEAKPQDLLDWTEGRAMIATGSPFAPVVHGGITYEIAQANNALVFPGIGLGTVAVRASRVTDGMIAAASEAVADMTRAGRPGAPVLPSMRQLRAVSAAVAVRVAQAAETDGVATQTLDDPIRDIYAQMWDPEYPLVDVVASIDEPSARSTEP